MAQMNGASFVIKLVLWTGFICAEPQMSWVTFLVEREQSWRREGSGDGPVENRNAASLLDFCVHHSQDGWSCRPSCLCSREEPEL